MKFLKNTLFISVAFISLGGEITIAAPHVYTGGGTFSDSQQSCLREAKRTARNLDYIEEEVIYGDGMVDFYATKRRSPVSLAVNCAGSIGVYSIGISSTNNDNAFDSFNEFYELMYPNASVYY